MVITTRRQRMALYRKFVWDNGEYTSYRQFRAAVQPTFGMDNAIVVPWCGMWLAIETDGYVHT